MKAQEKFASRLKLLRKESGLSQEKLAHKSGIDRTYVASVERGKRNISINNISKLVDALGISLADFFSSEIFE